MQMRCGAGGFFHPMPGVCFHKRIGARVALRLREEGEMGLRTWRKGLEGARETECGRMGAQPSPRPPAESSVVSKRQKGCFD